MRNNLAKTVTERNGHAHIPIPMIYIDNSSAMAIATNPILHQRTKHIEIDIHTVRDKVLQKEIILKKIETKENVADIFTKDVTGGLFRHLREKLQMKDMHTSSENQEKRTCKH